MKKTKLLLAALISMFAFTCGVKAIEVNTEEEFISAMNSGEDIKLTENIEVNSTITLDKEVELDLNAKEIAFALNKYIYLKGGNLNITGTGILYEKSPYFSPIIIKGSEKVEDVNYTTLTIGENVTIKGWAGLFIDQNNSKAYGVTVNVNGTTIGMKDTNGDLGSGIYLNGSITDNNNAPVINISSTAKISAEGQGIYAAGYGVWTIEEGASIEGNTGIEIRAGELNVNGGSIIGTAIPTETTPNGNGSTTAGAGIAVVQHTTKKAINVNIKNGTIKGYTAFYESNPQKNSVEDLAAINLNITGGTFEAISGGTNSVYSEDFTAFITGGTFNSDVVNYIANTYVVNENNGTYAVIENKVLETDDKKVTLESEKALDNTYTLEIEELGKEAKEEASKKVEETYVDNKEIKDTTLIKIYDIRIMKDREVISIENGKFTIAIAIPESDQKYDNYKVVYFDEEGKLVETLDAKLVNGKVVFTTTHLSTYGLVGNNNVVTEVVPEIIENPKTADINLALILALLGLSSVGTVLIITKKLVNENL